ncbi:hypothetical protein BH23CHL5_BH23CHL5_17490 [soil metagenome]
MMPSHLTVETIMLERRHRFESEAAKRRLDTIAATRSIESRSSLASWVKRATSFLSASRFQFLGRANRPSRVGQRA